MPKYCKIYIKDVTPFWDDRWRLYDEFPIPEDMDDATIKAKAKEQVADLRKLRIGRVRYKVVERKR